LLIEVGRLIKKQSRLLQNLLYTNNFYTVVWYKMSNKPKKAKQSFFHWWKYLAFCNGLVRDGARFKHKLMGVMVYFLPAKNKHQSVLRIRFPEHRKLQHITWIHDVTRCSAHNNTYLISRLLEAPCEYILYSLALGLNWPPFWPLPMSIHLVATPSPVSCCLLQWVGFHT
jgi:hypothetical protein